MFDTTMATSEILNLILNISLVVTGVIAAILGLLAALVGLGWGIRKFLSWVTGGTGGFAGPMMSNNLLEMEADHDLRNRVWKGGGNEM